MSKIRFLFIFLFFSNALLYGIEQQDIMSPDVAFKASALMKHKSIVAKIELGKDIYIYDESLKFNIIEPKKIELDPLIKRPKPILLHGFKVHTDDIEINIPLSLIKEKIDTKKFKLQIKYQGCSQKGLCYSPIKKVFEFELKDKKVKESKKESISQQDEIVRTLSKGSLLAILATFFGFGLLLSLTPCIFPMIPILSSIIVSQSKEKMSAARGFFLSLVYVLSMSVAYTIAGVIAGLFGSNLQIALQTPWVIVVFSAIFVALAFSMFGYYEIGLPTFLQSKIKKTSDKTKGHGIFSIAIMGFLSALIVGPCVAPPLAGALIYIGQSGDALLGGVALFVMSLGMGVPLFIVGIGAGKFMPKPGGWMENVSRTFGVIMLGVAIYMLSRILPENITMLLWAFLAIGSAIFLGALEPLKEGISGIRKMVKVIGVILLLYGIALFIGGLTKASNPLNPLERLIGASVLNVSNPTNKDNMVFKKIKNIAELENIVKNSKKPIMLDFYANWCISCKELEHITFSDEKVKILLRDFTLLQADVTQNNSEDKELLKRFSLFGPPGIIFFKNGKEIKKFALVGFIEPENFIKHLNLVKR